ncbi:hypothetical protein GB937_003863 [Aspergillus fischeri]|nr:hypothetical protein GB937_003863 [Aspergillus fischeri]
MEEPFGMSVPSDNLISSSARRLIEALRSGLLPSFFLVDRHNFLAKRLDNLRIRTKVEEDLRGALPEFFRRFLQFPADFTAGWQEVGHNRAYQPGPEPEVLSGKEGIHGIVDSDKQPVWVTTNLVPKEVSEWNSSVMARPNLKAG